MNQRHTLIASIAALPLLLGQCHHTRQPAGSAAPTFAVTANCSTDQTAHAEGHHLGSNAYIVFSRGGSAFQTAYADANGDLSYDFIRGAWPGSQPTWGATVFANDHTWVENANFVGEAPCQ